MKFEKSFTSNGASLVMDYSLTCPVCNTVYSEEMKFCGECGCNLIEIEAVTVTLNPETNKEKIIRNLKTGMQKIGEKTQQGFSDASTMISDKAFSVGEKASNMIVQERVSEAMSKLVNLMINVSKDVTKSMPADMVNAIDLEAEINFVAFTIGVSIDLAELNNGKKVSAQPRDGVIPSPMETS